MKLLLPLTALVFASTTAFAGPPEHSKGPECAPGEEVVAAGAGDLGHWVSGHARNEDLDPGFFGEVFTEYAMYRQEDCGVPPGKNK